MHSAHAPRRRRWAVAGVAGLVAGTALFPAAALASQTDTGSDPAIGPETDGTVLCTLPASSELDEVTGIVATSAGLLAVEGGDTVQPDVVEIWTITLGAGSCSADSELYYGVQPFDPQDLAVAADGTIWIADTGNGAYDDRSTRVAFEKVLPGGDLTIARTLYPASGGFHSQAMLLGADGLPIIFAPDEGATTVGLFKPGGALVDEAQDGLPTLTRVGQMTPVGTGTANPFGGVGNSLVTGAARSPDGTKVVVRTSSDAYEYTVGADGDVVAAIANGTPVITRLPNESDGKSITYSADGASFLTVSSTTNGLQVRSYQPFVPGSAEDPAPAGDDPAGGEAGGGLGIGGIYTLLSVLSALGFAVMVVGIVGIVRARRATDDDDDDYDEDDDEDDYDRRPRGGPGDRRGVARVPAGAGRATVPRRPQGPPPGRGGSGPRPGPPQGPPPRWGQQPGRPGPPPQGPPPQGPPPQGPPPQGMPPQGPPPGWGAPPRPGPAQPGWGAPPYDAT